jgi:hypothetical protein
MAGGYYSNKSLNLPKVPRFKQGKTEDISPNMTGGAGTAISRNRGLISGGSTAYEMLPGPGHYDVKDNLLYRTQAALPMSTTGRS